MSARPAPARTRPARPRSRKSPRSTIVRRWLLLLGAVAVAATVIILATAPFVDKAVHEVTLPLRHDDIIRQQARDKGLDPALIAAVIYTESRFRDQTSRRRRQGPDAADAAHRRLHRAQVRRHAFVQGDLATPQVNIAYGSWYLRYLLDKYDGNESSRSPPTTRAREGRRVVARRGGARRALPRRGHIPFPETRDYVTHVLQTRARLPPRVRARARPLADVRDDHVAEHRPVAVAQLRVGQVALETACRTCAGWPPGRRRTS
jgi:soluble lytic murein transglycosylase